MANKQGVKIKKIRKRDGRLVDFKEEKITKAIQLAGERTGEIGPKEAKRLTVIVVNLFEKANGDKIPSVEQVQDVVEQVLMAASYFQTAKAYIIYRKDQAKLRAAQQLIGVEDDLGMPVNALKAMARRYLIHDEKGNVIETPGQAVRRVARKVASVEKRKRKEWEDRFAELISSFKFVPAGCYFRGAGKKRGLLANCFVLPVEDDMGKIFDAVRWTALIHQAGGGTGYNFSRLRPNGDVLSGGGFASGPVSFMKAFDAATEIVMLGGRHRGANMGVLNAEHPDILEFISCKTREGEISNFNISIGASDKFMQAVEKGKEWNLINPRNGKAVQTIGARKIFDQAVAMAWRTGDPGMIYLDAINRNNSLLEALGPIDATNVCGEQPLHPFDVCNLGSINLAKFAAPSFATTNSRRLPIRPFRDSVALEGDKRDLKSISRLSKMPEKSIDWKGLEETVRSAVRFLDNGIDASEYPIVEIKKMAKRVRRIGLGVMGWADMLFALRVKYDSKEAVNLAEKIMKFIQQASWEESAKLANERGEFPLWKESSYYKKHPVLSKRGKKNGVKVRNISITTIAPTGTISMLADCSSGIEPAFALAYIKNVVDQHGLVYKNKYFVQAINDTLGNGQSSRVDEIISEVAKAGGVSGVVDVPKWIKEVFRTAHDAAPEWHIKMQAAFQKYTDNAVSKTINFPENAAIEEVEKAYIQAWKMGCKGITIYRDKSKNVQILSTEEGKEDKEVKIQSKLRVVPLSLRNQRSGLDSSKKEEKCPECGGVMYFAEGCSSCQECGYSRCEV